MIYLDNNATTVPDMQAISYAADRIINNFGNPSSLHKYGRDARNDLESSRENIARVMGCKSHEIYFTSGGTEANSLALSQGDVVLAGKTEHSSVYNHPGAHYIEVNKDGTVDLNNLEDILRANSNTPSSPQNRIVSLMLANNETGVITDPTFEAYDLCKKYKWLLHVDAVAGFGKPGVPWQVKEIKADMISISGHKVHGPKGIGVLFIKNEIEELRPLFSGGNHERGVRPGTENMFGILALGYICQNNLSNKEYINKLNNVSKLREHLENSLSKISQVNGSISNRVGNTTNLYFPELNGDVELFTHLLSHKGVCISGKSACNSGLPTPSRVLKAMFGDQSERLGASVRFSLSTDTTMEDIDSAVNIIEETLGEIRELQN